MQINTPTTQIHERSLGLVQITFMLINYRLYLHIVLKVTTSKPYNNITYRLHHYVKSKENKIKKKTKLLTMTTKFIERDKTFRNVTFPITIIVIYVYN